MLKNEYMDAKVGVDTAENEPKQASGWLFLQSRIEPAIGLRAALASVAEPVPGPVVQRSLFSLRSAPIQTSLLAVEFEDKFDNGCNEI